MKVLAATCTIIACFAWQPAAAQPVVTSVTATASPNRYVGPCPAAIEMVGTI